MALLCGFLLCGFGSQDVEDVKEKLAQSLFDHIPVGVGSQVGVCMNDATFEMEPWKYT